MTPPLFPFFLTFILVFTSFNVSAAAKPEKKIPKSYKLVEKILFSIGDEIITLSDQNQLKKELKAGLVSESLLLSIFTKKKLLSSPESLLDFLIAQTLIDLSLKEEKDLPSPSERHIQAGIKKLKGSRSKKAFNRKLKKNGLTLKTLKTNISSSLQRGFYIRKHFVSKIVVSNSDINGYFFNQKGQNLHRAFEYEFSFLAFPQTKEGLRKARASAKTSSDASFERIAKQTGARFEKHRLKSGEMSPAMEEALKNLSVSQISSLTPIGGSTYLFKLDWKRPVFTLKEEKERRSIHTLLLHKELSRIFYNWLKEKKSRYQLVSL